jgi:hypothetical protein
MAITYHVTVPTLEQVQEVVPFEIDLADPATAAWYLLGAVYGRDDEIWDVSDPEQHADWDALGVACIHGSAVGAIAWSLAEEYLPGFAFDMPSSLARVRREDLQAVLTAMLLYQYIADGEWEPTKELRAAQAQAAHDALPVGPVEYDDAPERATQTDPTI